MDTSYFIYSDSCLVDLGDSFVLTGSYSYGGDGYSVTQYNSAGLVKELPPLNTPRHGHGCSAYYTDNQPVMF